ncbi:hypothetical protein E4T52_04796 [Aureobasidium sp. EXF-3400]|nr:hypothetical protein E4T51_03935 [Aureobasidium sp. EXF-12344]KAI4780285.1 hypothetical protein E4T52_04796 [Aureobasidium sp. EXF-3400]
MSLAILPSHTPVSRPTAPTKRPKLSLNTASLPSTFGKSTTGLRLDAPSIASPTARNTFSNAYGSQHVSSPQALTSHQDVRPKSRLCLDTSVAPTHQHSARSSSTDSCMSATSATSASTESSTSSTSTIDPFDKPIPYRLPYNHHSILTNGPHGCVRRRKSFSSTRPMFPSPKKVSFRAPLTEDIHNNIYTLAHSDIDSTSSSSSALETLPSGHGHYVQQQQKHKRAADLPIRTPTSPACGDKRDSSSEDDSDSDICPQTPVTRKSKKPREWVWTLGPINPITPPPSSSPVDEQSLS